MEYISFDPYYRKENARFSTITDEQIATIIKESHLAWEKWSAEAIVKKRNLLKAAGQLLVREKEIHAHTIVSEMGKPVAQAIAEVEKCGSLCLYYADKIEKFSAPEKRASSHSESIVRYDPQGIILGIMPWNFPYWQAFRFIIPVIAGGNTVLLKHASGVPLCTLNIEKLFIEAGFPENIVRTLFVSHDQLEKIISRPEIRGVSLTGSTEAGRNIAATAGKFLKKAVLELGGSDPFIIFKDADLPRAADAAAFGRFQNCGQSCIAAKRLFVESDVLEVFLQLFTDRVKKIKCGDPYNSDTFIGPMVNEAAVRELEEQVMRSTSDGTIILTGGKRLAEGGYIYLPTVVCELPDDAPLLREEVFGPVIPVTQFSGVEEVIAMANNSTFGLGASIWTWNTDLALEIASKLDTGTVAINGIVKSDPALPFGGVKDSGFGRELSVEGFREFLNIKTVSIF